MRNRKSSRGFASFFIAGALVTATSIGFAEDNTALFKIVTTKDEIVVALSAEEIRKLGGNDVTHIGQALRAQGELTLWQYAVRKGNDGELEQAPRQRVSFLGHDSLRVEPYASPLRVVPVPAN